jgi:hypothetical protein
MSRAACLKPVAARGFAPIAELCKRGKSVGTQVQHNLTSGDRVAEIRRHYSVGKRNKV